MFKIKSLKKLVKSVFLFASAFLCAFCMINYSGQSNVSIICTVHATENDSSKEDKNALNAAIIYLREEGYTVSEPNKDGKYSITDKDGKVTEKTEIQLCQYASNISQMKQDGKYSFDINKDGDKTWTGGNYNKQGLLEKLVVEAFTAKVILFGEEIDFSDLYKTLSRFLVYSDFNKINVHASSQELNLYKVFRDVVWVAVKAIAISLATIMTMWRILKEGMEVERFSWQKLMMIIARLFLLNMFITYSWELIGFFFDWIMTLMNVFDFGVSSLQTPTTNVGYVFATGITESKSLLKGLYFTVGLAVVFLYYGTAISCIIKVVIRYIKILFCMAFSPMPLALCADRDYGTDAIRVFMMMCGIFIQAPIMKVSMQFYELLVSEFSASIANTSSVNFGTVIPICIGMGLLNGILSSLLTMSEEITEKIFN